MIKFKNFIYLTIVIFSLFNIAIWVLFYTSIGTINPFTLKGEFFNMYISSIFCILYFPRFYLI